MFTNMYTCTHINPLLTLFYPSLAFSFFLPLLMSTLTRRSCCFSLASPPPSHSSLKILFSSSGMKKKLLLLEPTVEAACFTDHKVSSFSLDTQVLCLWSYKTRADSQGKVPMRLHTHTQTHIDYSLTIVSFAWPVTSLTAVPKVSSNSQLVNSCLHSHRGEGKKKKMRETELASICRKCVKEYTFNLKHLTWWAVRVSLCGQNEKDYQWHRQWLDIAFVQPLLRSVIQCVKLTTFSCVSRLLRLSLFQVKHCAFIACQFVLKVRVCSRSYAPLSLIHPMIIEPVSEPVTFSSFSSHLDKINRT